MPIPEYRKICQEVTKVVIKAGKFIRSEHDKLKVEDLQFKDKNDLVSYVDIESENFLIKELNKITPGVDFLAEESVDKSKAVDRSFIWIIDPLDGTINYVHKIPAFCISIALMVENKIRIGIVYEINRRELYYSHQGSEAYLNDQIIRVSERSKLADSLLATGFPFREFNSLESYIKILESLMQNSRGIRRIGSAALDLAYVACGRFDGFFEYNLSPWDVAAGAYLVQQAGGKLNDFTGKENFIFGKEIIASNTKIHDELQSTIQEFHQIK